jgi:hypothetical protein
MQVTVRGTQLTITPLLLIVFVLGLGVAGYGAYDYVQQSDAVESAVAVETTITETQISKSSGRRLYYRVSVTHVYEYRGAEYTSTQVFPGATRPTYFVRSDAEGVVGQYNRGTTTTAYVTPDAPGRAFLERQTTLAPVKFIGFGGFIALLAALRAIGPENPTRDLEVDDEGTGELRQYETVLWLDRDSARTLSKRLMKIAPVGFVVAFTATVFLVLSADSSSVQAEFTDPLGLTLLAAFVSILVFISGIVLYGGWSFTECRRLRHQISEPRPRSPFRHPALLVSILTTSEELDEYGERVKLTGFVFAAAIFLIGILAFIIWTAA